MSLDTRYPLNLPVNDPPLRVLIVEDDPMMQLGLEQSLMAHPQLEIV
ncbi:MAG: DNA-binding response regulator, partial [Nostoc sp.]